MERKPTTVRDLLEGPLVAVNVGLSAFAENLEEQDIEVVRVEWAPPAGGDKDMIDLLDRLM